MAKGLFALVRRGSKLNYLDDAGRDLSQRQQTEVHPQNAAHIVKSILRSKEDHSSKENDTLESTTSKERTSTEKILLNLNFQKLSIGRKIARNSLSNSKRTSSAETTLTTKEVNQGLSGKPKLVLSVASGYFVGECNSSSIETTSKKEESAGKIVPCIILPDHDSVNIRSTACNSFENHPFVQYSRNFGSQPHLRGSAEKKKRPSSWTSESSPGRNDLTDKISKTTSVFVSNQNLGLLGEAVPISASPSQRRNKKESSLSPEGRHLSRLVSSLDRSGRVVDRSVRRAKSWGRGDEVTDSGIQQSRKVDIFLPTV